MANRGRSPARAKKLDPEHEKRTQQLAEVRSVIPVLQERLRVERIQRAAKLRMLDSVSEGLYEEIDKLSKKAPGEPVTDLVLEHVNEVIRETKELIDSDPYVQRLNEFVAAGDNPEHRDVVVVLRQIRQGLARFREELQGLQKREERKLVEARTVAAAIGAFLEDEGEVPSERDLGALVDEVADVWLTGSFGARSFNFDRLDRINIPAYFEVAANGG